MPASSPSRTPSRWTGLSPEERQRERRRLLVQAGFELLADEGLSGTTVRAVCAKARLNPRYFYESFDELDELLVAVYDDVMDQLRAELRPALAEVGKDHDAAVRATVEVTIRFVDADRRRGQVLYIEAMGNEALSTRRLQTGFDLVEVVERDAARRRGAPPGAEMVGRVGAAMLVGGFSETLAAWVEGRIEMSPDQLIDECTELCVTIGSTAGRLVQERATVTD